MGEAKRRKKALEAANGPMSMQGDVGQWVELTAQSVEKVLGYYKKLLEENKEKFNSKNFPYYIFQTSLSGYETNTMTNKQKISTLTALMSVMAAEIIVRQIEDEGKEAAEALISQEKFNFDKSDVKGSSSLEDFTEELGLTDEVKNLSDDDFDLAEAREKAEVSEDSHRTGEGDAIEMPKDFV